MGHFLFFFTTQHILWHLPTNLWPARTENGTFSQGSYLQTTMAGIEPYLEKKCIHHEWHGRQNYSSAESWGRTGSINPCSEPEPDSHNHQWDLIYLIVLKGTKRNLRCQSLPLQAANSWLIRQTYAPGLEKDVSQAVPTGTTQEHITASTQKSACSQSTKTCIQMSSWSIVAAKVSNI